ncbi:hypothetical protein Sjap_010015 [Stephania japonica]|uniref:Uncharacterized protein n=1 Tax=Stephania japonica TaxID=461633 RepID=A0AAP0JAW8_9MAGN
MQHTNEELIVEDQVMQQTGGKLLVEDHSGYQTPVVNEADQGSIPDITDVDILSPIATAEMNMHAKEANISKFAQPSSGPFEMQHLMHMLKSIEEDIQEVKEALQQTNTTLKNEMSAMMRVEWSMLKEKLLNFFTHAIDKIEDRGVALQSSEAVLLPVPMNHRHHNEDRQDEPEAAPNVEEKKICCKRRGFKVSFINTFGGGEGNSNLLQYLIKSW